MMLARGSRVCYRAPVGSHEHLVEGLILGSQRTSYQLLVHATVVPNADSSDLRALAGHQYIRVRVPGSDVRAVETATALASSVML